MQVNLSWTPVTGALYYKIYRGLFTGGPYDLIGTSNPVRGTNPATTFQDGPDGLANGQDYFYVVSSVTTSGESSYSAEYAATVSTQPSSPALTGTTT